MDQVKTVSQSRIFKSSHVLPPDTNNHGTLFGGKLMAYIDDVAALCARKHSRCNAVTASTDSIDFIKPVKVDNEVCLEAFVTWTHKTSMEIFVRVLAEDLFSGERIVCATSFLTFVAIGDDGRPTEVPKIIPQTEVEKFLHQTAPDRAKVRKQRRVQSKNLIEKIGSTLLWEEDVKSSEL
ncbi:acyl-CoA hydrolase [Pullulanibacillus pueri]|uniref:Putative acyl-CoA thioester hydrolase YkhA n=1 Tax=Pullulanibacillus pueri TaxID=1437324 RepID=A0A8J2ZRU9_9BACL|nr:acyl-CoA thioesterase [Pullulanibacillus pueri]MBM7679996.1 acyl-CoA hydrolase [Pullulanibacillus pueri]GGH73850.1 putative acyl-CoA thioester hydrolase YkhA [Pullulanibacillus pueri]